MYVTALSTTPIKGLRIQHRSEIVLEQSGVAEDRRFFLIDERKRMVNGKQLGELMKVLADYSDAERTLTLTFADGREVAGEVRLGDPLEVSFYSRQRTALPVLGPFSEALSEHSGRLVSLVEADRGQGGVDRGSEGAVSLISRASLAALATVAGQGEVDGRRFRMLIEIDGVQAHEEDRWVGGRFRVGAALVAFAGHVGRCLITSRDPETGEIDLPTLDLLRSYRGSETTAEQLPFGIYGRVLEPGSVRVGDLVEPT
jgi:uncharacterized protein YcbX